MGLESRTAPLSGNLMSRGEGESAHENVQELEDAFVSKDVQDVPRLGVDDRQPVDLILQKRVDGFKQAEGQTKKQLSLLKPLFSHV